MGGANVWVASPSHLTDLSGKHLSPIAVPSPHTARRMERLTTVTTGRTRNGLNGSIGVSVSGGDVWIANANGNSVTELDAKNWTPDS